MVCPTCGLDNDPSATACARCNTALGAAPPPMPPSTPYPMPTGSAAGYDRPPRNRLALIAGLSVVLLIAVIVVVYRAGRSDPPAPATIGTAATEPATGLPAEPIAEPTAVTTTEPVAEPAADPVPQAQAIDAVLDRSGASRDKLNSAIDRVGRCTGLSGAVDDLRGVGDERRTQLAEVRDADLSAVPDGESLRGKLITALQYSLDADAAYVQWAEPTLSGGCAGTAGRKAAYARGRSASDNAGTAKQSFLAAWNPIATRLGLPVRSRQDI
jgi:hypothetical protein